MSKQFYITTAIDYPSGKPHMGHAYEKIITDTYARWYRWMGYDTFFLTGTDENGQKLVKTAQEAGRDTKDFVDELAQVFRKLCEDLQLSHDDFIRTTEERHLKSVQKIWKKLEEKGDIYSGEYEGQYCIQCETFYTETQSPDGQCPVHQIPLDKVKEKGFFFKLSEYADWIESYIDTHSEFIRPESARKEILQRIRSDKIRDLSVSRPNQGWGIAIEAHPDFVAYTWFDALINYYSAVESDSKRAHFWPADCHVIGKDITWFHTIIWPSVLKAAELPLPKQIYVHGMVLGEDGRKMSKAAGNGVDPYEVISKFPLDSFRYYLLRAIPSGLDGAFVREDLRKRHNNELANDYGNSLMRVVKLALKKRGSEFSAENVKADFDFSKLPAEVHALMEQREHHRAIEKIWEKVAELNLYLNQKEPWKMEASGPEFYAVIYNSLYAIYCISACLEAFLPGVSPQAISYLGLTNKGPESFEFGSHQFKLQMPEPLFPKIE